MRIYISGGISNIPDYKERFKKAEEFLTSQGYKAINPTVLDAFPLNYEEYMDLDLALIDICGAMYMLKDWEKSCGANREYGYALAKDLIILKEESWQEKN